MYKVRFNLGRGSNFRKWQVRDKDNKPTHFDPMEVTLVMSKCQLKNNKNTANKIFEGSHKTVCAWIECESVNVIRKNHPMDMETMELKYNPRKNPYWTIGDSNEDIDNEKYDLIYSGNTHLYTPKLFFD